MNFTIRTFAFGLLLLATACKKDDSSQADVSYNKLGDVAVNGLTGFAANGDPLASKNNGEAVRWNSGSQQWERLRGQTLLPDGTYLAAVGEDAAGNFYSASSSNGNFVLAEGSNVWQPISLPDTDVPVYRVANPPFINSSGVVVMQTQRQTSTGVRERIYRKSLGATTWTLVNDRATDYRTIVQLADNGDIFLDNINGDHRVYVLKNGSATLAPAVDCAGTVILPYCGFSFGVSPAGDVVFHQGGTGSRQLYRIDAGATYPATARELYKLPDGTSNFLDFATLANGTTLGVANNGGYGEYKLYIRKLNRSSWQEAPSLPGASGSYSYVRTNRQGQAFTSSRQSANSEGSVYRISF